MNAKAPLQATKWLKVPVLLDSNEMNDLFQELGDFQIYPVGNVTKKSEAQFSKEAFLKIYSDYVSTLKAGNVPQEALIRSAFSSVFTLDKETIYDIPVGTDQQINKVHKPVVQLQIHRLDYSTVDGKFRSMILGPETISWGIQFSYPQLTQNEKCEIISISESPEFPNTALFKQIQRWIRHHTTPTPFIVNGEKTNVPVRLGKACYSWINQHPQLIKKNLKVSV